MLDESDALRAATSVGALTASVMLSARSDRRSRVWSAAWPLALKAAISIGLIVFLLRHQPWSQVMVVLGRLPVGAATLALLLLVLVTPLSALRWWLVDNAIGGRQRPLEALIMMFVGNFFSQVLPTSFGGDAVRAWHNYRQGHALRSAVNGVVLDRVVGSLGLAIMAALGVGILGDRLADPLIRWVLLAVPLVIAAGSAGVVVFGAVPLRLCRFRAFAGIAVLGADARALCRAGRAAGLALGIALLGHAITAASVHVLAVGVGATVSPWDSLAVVPMVILIVLLPVSFAGWGVREGAMVTLFGVAGVPGEVALVVSILFGVLLLAAALPGLALYLGMRFERGTAR